MLVEKVAFPLLVIQSPYFGTGGITDAEHLLEISKRVSVEHTKIRNRIEGIFSILIYLD